VAAGTLLLTLGLASCTPDKPTEPASTASPSTTAATLDLTLEGLDAGPAPKIAFAHGTLLDDETDRDVLRKGLVQFAETKQLLVMRDGGGDVYAYSPDGPTSTTPIGEATGDLAINAERNLVAWIAPDGSPTVLQEGEAKPAVLEKQDGVTSGDAVAVLGHDCFNGPETVEGAGCSVYFRSNGESFVASNHGFVEPITGGKGGIALLDADLKGEVGWTTLNRDPVPLSIYTPRDNGDGKPRAKVWDTNDYMPLAFSPDGKHVLATGPRGFEAPSVSTLSILDRANGKPVLNVPYNPKSKATIADMAWEDSTHVLAVVNQKFEWALVRIGLNGSLELASKPFTYKNAKAPDRIQLQLAVQP